MVKISICIGSACHLSGAHGVLNAFMALVEKHQLQGLVDIEGNFCQGRCTEGVVVKINDEIITQVSKAKVQAIFADKVLSVLGR
ncbi:MAG: (2Fe-2S) ferredoxin domain-containing protein [Sporomusaceae bacterium]|nr:(2Fe-2S) ferredoxin domain-containing protein [Sporomusaceae bacterium]